MPMRVIPSSLPGVSFDDSGASPFIPAIAQAGNTLLELGPKLAQIRMQQAANERDYGLRKQEMGLQERRIGQDDTRIGYEGRRVGVEEQMAQPRINQMQAEVRSTQQRNILDLAKAGGDPSSMAAEYGVPPESILGAVTQAHDASAADIADKQSQAKLREAQGDYFKARPDLEQTKIDDRKKADEDAIRIKDEAQDQALHVKAVDNVEKALASMTSPEAQQYSKLMAQDPAAAQRFKMKLIEGQKAALDPGYQQRKQAAFAQSLGGMMQQMGVK